MITITTGRAKVGALHVLQELVVPSLEISGDWEVAENADITGNLDVGGDAEVTGNATVTADLTVGGNAEVTGAVTVLDIVSLGVVFAVGVEDNDAITVGLQVNDGHGDPVEESKALYWYLSDNDDGSSLAGTAPDTVAAGTDGLLIEAVAKKAGLLVTEADGDMDIAIGENGADTWYLVVVLPNGSLAISDAITFAA